MVFWFGGKSSKRRIRRKTREPSLSVDQSYERLGATSLENISPGNGLCLPPSDLPSKESPGLWMEQKKTRITRKTFGSIKKRLLHRPKWLRSGFEGVFGHDYQECLPLLSNADFVYGNSSNGGDSPALSPGSPLKREFQSTSTADFRLSEQIKEILLVRSFVTFFLSRSSIRGIPISLFSATRNNTKKACESSVTRVKTTSECSEVSEFSFASIFKLAFGAFTRTICGVWRLVQSCNLRLRNIFKGHASSPEANWLCEAANARNHSNYTVPSKETLFSVSHDSYLSKENKTLTSSPFTALKLKWYDDGEYYDSEITTKNSLYISDNIKEPLDSVIDLQEPPVQVYEAEIFELTNGYEEIERTSVVERSSTFFGTTTFYSTEIQEENGVYTGCTSVDEGVGLGFAADFAAILSSASAVGNLSSLYAEHNILKKDVYAGTNVASVSVDTNISNFEGINEPEEDFKALEIIASIISAQISGEENDFLKKVWAPNLDLGTCEHPNFAPNEVTTAYFTNAILPNAGISAPVEHENTFNSKIESPSFSPKESVLGVVCQGHDPCTKNKNSWADYDSDDDSIYEDFFASYGRTCPSKDSATYQTSPLKELFCENSAFPSVPTAIDDLSCIDIHQTGLMDSEFYSEKVEAISKGPILKLSIEDLFASVTSEAAVKPLNPLPDQDEISFTLADWKKVSLEKKNSSVSVTRTTIIDENPDSQQNKMTESSRENSTGDVCPSLNIGRRENDEIGLDEVTEVLLSYISLTEGELNSDIHKNDSSEPTKSGGDDIELLEDFLDREDLVDDYRWEGFTNRDSWRLTELFRQMFEETKVYPSETRSTIVKFVIEEDVASGCEQKGTEIHNDTLDCRSPPSTPTLTESESLLELETLFSQIEKVNSVPVSLVLKKTARMYCSEFMHLIKDLAHPCDCRVKELVDDIQSIRSSLWGLFSFGSGLDTELKSVFNAINDSEKIDCAHWKEKIKCWDITITDISLQFEKVEKDLDKILKGLSPRFKEISDMVSQIITTRDHVLGDYKLFCDTHDSEIRCNSLKFHRYTHARDFEEKTEFLFNIDLDYVQEFLADDLESLSMSKEPMENMMRLVREGFANIETRMTLYLFVDQVITDCNENSSKDGLTIEESDTGGTNPEMPASSDSQIKRKRNNASRNKRRKNKKKKH